MKKKQIFHSACFDAELLRKQTIILNENSIEFKVIQQSKNPQFRSPLSGYIEAEIHVLEEDFEKADKLLTAFYE